MEHALGQNNRTPDCTLRQSDVLICHEDLTSMRLDGEAALIPRGLRDVIRPLVGFVEWQNGR
jgi:hypothetical protein